MLNKVMLIGRLGQDPELRYAQSGAPILNLNVATDESYTDRDGNRQERVEWHRVAVFDRAAENCATNLRKGSLVFVEGKLVTRKWKDAQGADRQVTEIRAQTIQALDEGRRDAGGLGNSRASGRPANARWNPPEKGAAGSGANSAGAYPSENVSPFEDSMPF